MSAIVVEIGGSMLRNTADGERSPILYAPNVHIGGGLILLRSLLASWPSDRPMVAFLDVRARLSLQIPKRCAAVWVKPTIISRLSAEVSLHKAARMASFVLCFHGLPPLLRLRVPVYVFLQNRLYVQTQKPLEGYPWRTALRLRLERLILLKLSVRVSVFIVQTQSMKSALIEWHLRVRRLLPSIKILAFTPPIEVPRGDGKPDKAWDFVYVSDGQAHKNHIKLFAAWELLAQEGLYPSLIVTLGYNERLPLSVLECTRVKCAARIHNVGVLDHEKILKLYASSRALIYPSTCESYGLPLAEAREVGLPIVAAEMDYVRDVCMPTETFDPSSPLSISRAVKRFLGSAEVPGCAVPSAAFWEEVTNFRLGQDGTYRQ